MSQNPETITAEEINLIEQKIMDYTNKPKAEPRAYRDYLMFMVMVEAGLRVGEVAGLQIGDLIFEKNPALSLRVRMAIAKNKRERIIPVSERFKIAIQWWYRITYTTFVPNDSRPVFYSSRTGRNITTRQIERIIGTYTKLAIGREINPHVLRHTFATRLMRVTSMRVVQQLLGHKSIKTTQIYTHPNGDDRQEAIGKI